MVCNLFGTLERARFLFRDSLEAVRRLVELKIDPAAFWKNPWRHCFAPAASTADQLGRFNHRRIPYAAASCSGSTPQSRRREPVPGHGQRSDKHGRSERT
jgi:hypothetical protein